MADDGLHVSIEANAGPAVVAELGRMLDRELAAAGSPPIDRHFTAVLRDDWGTMRGGVTANAQGGWLYVSALVVDGSCRRQGHGGRLLRLVEDWGRSQQCHGAYLTTTTRDARAFYERAGYRVFTELPGPSEPQTRHYLKKSL